MVVSRDDSRAARHLLHHGAGVQRVGVVTQDAPGKPSALPVLVGANLGLARHMLSREYERWPTDNRSLQHAVCFLVGGVKLGWLVAPARLQRLAQDVLLGDARKRDRVLEDVHSKVCVERLHLLQRLQEGSDVQIVVVLQPVAEGLHASLAEDAVAVVVLLEGENVLVLERGIPCQIRGQAWEVQLGWAVEPLVGKPGLGERGAVGLDPLVVSDAWGQIVHNIQELELGSVDEHDAAVLLRREHIFVSRHEWDKVLADKLEVVVPRVETQHRHLREPPKEKLVLRCRDAFDVWGEKLGTHIRHDCRVTDKGSGVPGDYVLRLRVECVCDGN